MLDRALSPTFSADSYYFSMRLIAMRGPQTDPFTFKILIQKGVQKADNTKGVYNMEGTSCALNDEFLNFNVPVYNPNRSIDFTVSMTDENLGVYTSFNIPSSKFISEFISNGKNTYQETSPFADESYELEYVIYIEKSRGGLLNLIRNVTQLPIPSPFNSPAKISGDVTPTDRSPINRRPEPKVEPKVDVVVEAEVEEPKSAKKSVTPTKIQRRSDSRGESSRNQSSEIKEPAAVEPARQVYRQPPSPIQAKPKEEVLAKPEEVEEHEPAPKAVPKVEPPKSKPVEKLERSTEKVRTVQQVKVEKKPVEKIQPPKQEKAVPSSAAKKVDPAPARKPEPPAKKVERPAEKVAAKAQIATQGEGSGNRNKLIIAALIVAAVIFGLLFVGGGSAGKKEKEGRKKAGSKSRK